MKRIYLLVLFSLGLFTTVSAQLTATATWMGGDSTASSPAVFGTKGVADPANIPGGRWGAVSWTDASGKFWLMGGYGVIYSMPYAVLLNDLWMYDPSSGNWTWVSGDSTADVAPVYGTKGVANPANTPGGRESAVSWTDPSGNFWLMGGNASICCSGSFKNDLWMFDPSSGNWTWVSGDKGGDQPGVYGTKGVADPANTPGGRIYAASWTDASGKLWLMGGEGHIWSGGGLLNDLWMFDPSTRNWTWVGGDNTFNPSGNYGTKGVADPSNQPCARFYVNSWTDASGNLWLMGGIGDLNDNSGTFNDLWQYNPSSGNWTWISGDSSLNQSSVFGAKGIADPTNKPGATAGAVTWADASGKFWLMGGAQYRRPYYNYLWQYDPSSGNWTWVSGDSTGNSLGLYGTKGVTDSATTPRARAGAVGWMDASGKFWLMGGSGYSSNNGDFLNDLWRYDIQLLAPVTVATSPSGVSFSVDGTAYTSSQTFHWVPGSSHTITTRSPQNGTTGTKYIFSNWSDGGTLTHNVTTLSSATTYTANFNTQYLLTTSASTGGSISPASGYYDAGSNVSITATANTGYGFSGFSGALSGTTNPQTLTLTAPASVAANFTAGSCPNATNLTTSINGTSATLNWEAFINPAQWQVQYKTTAPGSKWVDVFKGGNARSTILTGLKANQTYQWHIRAKCGKTWNSYSNAVSFKTGSSTLSISNAITSTEKAIDETDGLQVRVLPNPSTTYFTLIVQSNNNTPLSLRMADAVGRIIEGKTGIAPNSTLRIGSDYRPGIYFAQVLQGSKMVTLKLIKQ